LKKHWGIGAITAEYLARMEDGLPLYRLPYNGRRPVACCDELPVQLVDDVGEEVPMKGGKPARFAYEDARGGAASWRVAFEPLTGKWLVGTSKQRPKADYCRFPRRVAALFPAADKVVLVPDTLNTPNAGALYEDLPPAEAFASA
jgi:hypothetical protein